MRLVVDRVHHRYAPIEVLRDIAFTVEPGRIVCIIGPSGCDKSIRLRLIGGLERPDQGRVLIAGVAILSGIGLTVGWLIGRAEKRLLAWRS